MARLTATIIGGGIFGLWQAFELARRGHAVTLHEAMSEAQTGGASRVAGAMLAPYCEAEGAERIVQAQFTGDHPCQPTINGAIVGEGELAVLEFVSLLVDFRDFSRERLQDFSIGSVVQSCFRQSQVTGQEGRSNRELAKYVFLNQVVHQRGHRFRVLSPLEAD